MMRKLNIKHAIGTFTNRSKLRSRKEWLKNNETP